MFLLTSSKIETLREIKRKNIKWKRDQEFTKHRLYALFNSVQDRYRGIWSIDKKGGEKDKFINLPHGPLVDLNLLDKVQNKLDEVAVKKRKPGKNYLYLLTSLLVHEDGSKFTGQPAKERQYRYYYNPQNKLRINCEEIDELVIKRLAEYISNQDYLVKLISSAMSKKAERLPQVKEQLKITQESLSKIEQDENDLRCKFEFTQGRDNSVINSWLEEQILSLRAKKEACNKELERLGSIQNELLRPIPIANLQKHIRDFLGKKDDMRFHRRTLLELIFNKIVIKGSDVIELHLFDDIFRENFNGEVGLGKNKATSLHCGLNGGSNKT